MSDNREYFRIADIVSSIVDIRKQKQYGDLSFETDFSNTISALLILESHFDKFEELSLIRKLKSILLNYLLVFGDDYAFDFNDHLQIDSFSTSMGIKRKIVERNLIQQSDIEPLKKKILDEISATISNLSDEEIINSFATSQKKMKATHNFLLDLDSYQLSEPLENILSILRRDSGNSDALKKIFSMDIEDFIDHPQWLELIELLRRSLFSNNVLVVHIVVKFGTQLSKHQAIDALRLLTNYFHSLFCIPLRTQEFVNVNEPLVMYLTDAQKLQINALFIVLFSVSKHGLSGSELDDIIFVLFLVLTDGILMAKINDADVPLYIFDIMLESNKDLSFVKQLCVKFVPLSILYHAINSKFIFKLIGHIKELEYICSLDCSNEHRQKKYPRRLLLSSIIFLEFLCPFASNGYVKQICCSDKNIIINQLIEVSAANIEFDSINNKIMKVLKDSKNVLDNSKIFLGCLDPCPIFDHYFSTIVTTFTQSIYDILMDANVHLIKNLITLTITFVPYTTTSIRKYLFESYSKVFQEVIDVRAKEMLYYPLLFSLIDYFASEFSSSDDLNELFHLVKMLSDWYLISHIEKDILNIRHVLILQTYLVRFTANNDLNFLLVKDIIAPMVSTLISYLLSQELVRFITDCDFGLIFITTIAEYELLANLVLPSLDPMLQNVFSILVIQFIKNNYVDNNILNIMRKIIKSNKCTKLLSHMAFETLQLFLSDHVEESRIEFCIEDPKLFDILRIVYEMSLIDKSRSTYQALSTCTRDLCDLDLLLKSVFLNDMNDKCT